MRAVQRIESLEDEKKEMSGSPTRTEEVCEHTLTLFGGPTYCNSREKLSVVARVLIMRVDVLLSQSVSPHMTLVQRDLKDRFHAVLEHAKAGFCLLF